MLKIHVNTVASIQMPIQRTNDDRTMYNLYLVLTNALIHAVDSTLETYTIEHASRFSSNKSAKKQNLYELFSGFISSEKKKQQKYIVGFSKESMNSNISRL